MSKVTNTSAEHYAGWDGDRVVNIPAGATCEVSEEKVAQLKRDFPGTFDLSGKPAAPPADPSAKGGRRRATKPPADAPSE